MRKLPFPERGEMGVFGPRNPLFQEIGIRAPVWGQGNPKFMCLFRSLAKFKCAFWAGAFGTSRQSLASISEEQRWYDLHRRLDSITETLERVDGCAARSEERIQRHEEASIKRSTIKERSQRDKLNGTNKA